MSKFASKFAPSGAPPSLSLIVEIRAAEGGADAKDIVLEQLSIYAKRASRHRL